MANIPDSLNTLVIALRNTSRRIIRDYNEVEYLQNKNEGAEKFTDAAIERIEDELLADIRKIRPKYSYVKSNGERIQGSDTSNTIHINPMGGRENFVRGNPYFTTSVALERDSKPYAGAILHPLTNELFYGEKGSGAFMNNRKLRLPKIPPPLIALSDRSTIYPKHVLLRITGCPALDLAYYVAGRVGAVYYDDAIPLADAFVGKVLIEELDGKMLSKEGNSWDKETTSLWVFDGQYGEKWADILKGIP